MTHLTDAEWSAAIQDLRSGDLDAWIRAATLLEGCEDPARIPALYELLNDEDVFLYEVVGSPLANLEGSRAFVPLFMALLRCLAFGHDGDGLVTTVIGVTEMYPHEVAAELKKLRQSTDAQVLDQVKWCCEFLPSAIRDTITD